jgi:hypothetical protein
MGIFEAGKGDKAQDKGQVNPNKFTNDTDRKQYQAGWNKQREEEARRKKK